MPTSVPTSDAPTSIPTLNPLEAAIATQNAVEAEEQAARPTPIPLPEDSLQLNSPDGKNIISFALVDGVPSLILAPGGGQAIRFYPAAAGEMEELPTYPSP